MERGLFFLIGWRPRGMALQLASTAGMPAGAVSAPCSAHTPSGPRKRTTTYKVNPGREKKTGASVNTMLRLRLY